VTTRPPEGHPVVRLRPQLRCLFVPNRDMLGVEAGASSGRNVGVAELGNPECHQSRATCFAIVLQSLRFSSLGVP
jgi:hypothetical protein